MGVSRVSVRAGASAGRAMGLGSAFLATAILLAPARASAAPEKVVLNFDSAGAGSFRTALNDAASTASLGTNYFSAADASDIAADVQARMTALYTGFNVTFTTT